MTARQRQRGLSLPAEMMDEVQHQLDVRAWSVPDWALAAGVHPNTASRYLLGHRIDKRIAAALWRAFAEYQPVPGLKEALDLQRSS